MVIGDVILDHYLECSKSFSVSEGVPVYKINNEYYFPGGAANVAYNLTDLGLPTLLFSTSGVDKAGGTLLQLLERKLNTCNLYQSPFQATTQITRILSNESTPIRIDQEVNIPLDRNIRELLLTGIYKKMKTVKYIVLSDYEKGIFDLKTTQSIITHAQTLNIPVAVDPKGSVPDKYCGATLLTPNLVEFNALTHRQFSNIFDAVEEAKHFRREHDLDILILKGDKDGSIFIADQVIHQAPLVNCPNIQCIGAGDSFLAAFVAAVVKGLKPEEAFAISNIAAGIAISHSYTYSVTLDDIKSFINQEESHGTA